MAVSNETNLILQSYMSVVLITELNNNNLLNSGYYENMIFSNPEIKKIIKEEIGIGNQGMLLMLLYAMLVVPKELISKKYPAEYLAINEYLKSSSKNTKTNYNDDQKAVNFIRHIRNSLGHLSLEINANNCINFYDKNIKRKEHFETEIDIKYIGEFLSKLEKIHFKYSQDMFEIEHHQKL
jgi:hypothetical protein